MKNLTLPKLGMRTVKTGICLFICIALYYITSGTVGLYTAIVAIVCLQNTLETSLDTGKARLLGTAIGGAFGLLILFILGTPISTEFNIMLLFSIPIALIILIYLCTVLKIHSSIPIASIVFISIFINTSTDLTPFLFALTRIMDTLIGVLVAMVVNIYISPARKKEKQQMHIECDNFEIILMRIREEIDKDTALILYDSYLTDESKKKIKKPYSNLGIRVSIPVEHVDKQGILTAHVKKDFHIEMRVLFNNCGYIEIPPETMPCTVVWQH